MKSTILLTIFSIALTATAQSSHTPDKDLDCSSTNYTPFTGPLGSFCPLASERCCAFLCSNGRGPGPICSQTGDLEQATCTACKYDTVVPEPTCDASNTPTPKAFELDSCAPASSPNPCCAYICQKREGGVYEPKCYSKPQRDNGLWCLRCHTDEQLAAAKPGNNGTSGGNGTAPTSTGYPQPTYSSGAGALTYGAGALVGLFSLMFAM